LTGKKGKISWKNVGKLYKKKRKKGDMFAVDLFLA